MNIVGVALDVPVNTLFDYLAEKVNAGDIGRRVLVSFGRQQLVGVILEIKAASEVAAHRLKPVINIYRDTPALPEYLLKLLRFCADYYHHPIGEVVLNALPSRLRQTTPLRELGNPLYMLTASGLALEDHVFPRNAAVKRRLLLALRTQPMSRSEIAALSPRATQVLQAFMSKGWVEAAAAQEISPAAAIPAPTLTAEQTLAVAHLAKLDHFEVCLLFGVTGSGKTEVYLQAIAQQLAKARQVLVIVPEINLTPQLEKQFAQRFPAASVVSLHSALSPIERLKNWLDAGSGKAKLILGTRLAVFTPLPDLGLVIIDEEHDASLKQQEGLRYHARDVAIMRARAANVPIILGSATPALETYHNALSGRYSLVRLTQRAVSNATLPAIKILDLRTEHSLQGFSNALVEAIKKRLNRKEQALIFLNRRGFAPVLTCYQCGWCASCSRCATHLVAHKRDHCLRCHLCGHRAPLPAACPDCGNVDLTLLGQATQRLEATLTKFFPHARVLRIDSDSARGKGELQKLLQQAASADVDILVGTQILAKGHDFQSLTLVGVVDVDSMLYSTDFRAPERLFAQLVQVAGRAGRAGKLGEVLIQTRAPQHPIFSALKTQDYGAFAHAELSTRRAAGFPPFVFQALLRAEANNMEKSLQFLVQAARAAPLENYPITLFNAVAATMPRIAGKYRAQLLVQCASRKVLQPFLTVWVKELRLMKNRQVRWSLDVDPLEIS